MKILLTLYDILYNLDSSIIYMSFLRLEEGADLPLFIPYFCIFVDVWAW